MSAQSPPPAGATSSGVAERRLPELDAQYRVLREGAGVLERSERDFLLVRGADAAEFLQGQLTNDVEALAPGEGCYAALLDRKARIQADARVLRLAGDETLLDSEGIAVAPLRRHLDLYKVGREVEIGAPDSERTIVSLIGQLASELTGVPAAPEFAHVERTIGGHDVLGVATADGVDLIVPVADSASLHEHLLEAGAEPVTPEAAEIIRVEAGRPRFGAEFGPETMPAEAGIVERAVNFEKGCYIGQEPVARLHYKGRPNRRLCGLALSDPASRGEELRLDGKTVGKVGTACVSPALGPIALAVVRREAEPGARLELDRGRTAEVVALPFAGRPPG